jgi:protocatechuate 3,4-dioxygenase alpha subunit
MGLITTPSQTVGPFFSIGLEPLTVTKLAEPNVPGEHVVIRGRVLDGDRSPVPDALIEIWQANAHGKYAHSEDSQKTSIQSGFLGHGRVPTNDNGEFEFATIKPGAVPGPNGKMQAPHLVVSIFMRGLLKQLVTRIYFPDEAANADDLVLNLVEPVRRTTLIAHKAGDHLHWDVVLQGTDETVFFDC